MAIAINEDTSGFRHRGLSEWWNDETEYILQRIERWAALARGYNRLRTERLSRETLTMQEEQESHWSIFPNRIIIENPKWSPRFHNIRRSHRRKSRNDENCRINCCGTFNYQSSCNLDSSCLENYRYDHSIYFKTIGDIKSSKRKSTSLDNNIEEERTSGVKCSEWETESSKTFDHLRNDDYLDDELDNFESFTKDNSNLSICTSDLPIDVSAIDQIDDRERRRYQIRNVWPIVDLDKLNIDVDNDRFGDQSGKIGTHDQSNLANVATVNDDKNNNDTSAAKVDSAEKMIQLNINELTANQTRLDSSIGNDTSSPQRNRVGITRVTSMRRSRRTSRKVRQPVIVGDNNVSWPGVLLNYTKNPANVALSPHHYRTVKVK